MRLKRCDGFSGCLGQVICRTLRLGAALTGSVTEALERLCLGDGLGGTLDLAASLTGAPAEVIRL